MWIRALTLAKAARSAARCGPMGDVAWASHRNQPAGRKGVWVFAVSVLLLIAECRVKGISSFTSAKICKALYYGTAREYDVQYTEIIERIEAAAEAGEAVVTVPAMTVRTPEIFKDPELSPDGTGWASEAMARYYGVEIIRTKQSGVR